MNLNEVELRVIRPNQSIHFNKENDLFNINFLCGGKKPKLKLFENRALHIQRVEIILKLWFVEFNDKLFGDKKLSLGIFFWGKNSLILKLVCNQLQKWGKMFCQLNWNWGKMLCLAQELKKSFMVFIWKPNWCFEPWEVKPNFQIHIVVVNEDQNQNEPQVRNEKGFWMLY